MGDVSQYRLFVNVIQGDCDLLIFLNEKYAYRKIKIYDLTAIKIVINLTLIYKTTVNNTDIAIQRLGQAKKKD